MLHRTVSRYVRKLEISPFAREVWTNQYGCHSPSAPQTLAGIIIRPRHSAPLPSDDDRGGSVRTGHCRSNIVCFTSLSSGVTGDFSNCAYKKSRRSLGLTSIGSNTFEVIDAAILVVLDRMIEMTAV